MLGGREAPRLCQAELGDRYHTPGGERSMPRSRQARERTMCWDPAWLKGKAQGKTQLPLRPEQYVQSEESVLHSDENWEHKERSVVNIAMC